MYSFCFVVLLDVVCHCFVFCFKCVFCVVHMRLGCPTFCYIYIYIYIFMFIICLFVSVYCFVCARCVRRVSFGIAVVFVSVVATYCCCLLDVFVRCE